MTLDHVLMVLLFSGAAAAVLVPLLFGACLLVVGRIAESGDALDPVAIHVD